MSYNNYYVTKDCQEFTARLYNLNYVANRTDPKQKLRKKNCDIKAD